MFSRSQYLEGESGGRITGLCAITLLIMSRLDGNGVIT